MTRNIDVALLRAFVAAVESGGVTKAARLLNLTQAAVSQQIRRLEELFGVPLFVRARRSLRLTPHGERLLVHAQRMTALNDQILGLMISPDYEGELRVGVPYDVLHPVLPAVLRRFSRAWPKVRVTLAVGVTATLLAALDSGELDLTLATERDVPLRAEVLVRDALVWAGAEGGTAFLRDPLPVSIVEPDCMFRSHALAALAAAGRAWRPVSEASNYHAILVTLLADLAVAPMLRMATPEGLAALGPKQGLPALPDFHVTLHVRDGCGPGLAGEFAALLRAEFTCRYGRDAMQPPAPADTEA